jgi:hypothetical protein
MRMWKNSVPAVGVRSGVFYNTNKTVFDTVYHYVSQ